LDFADLYFVELRKFDNEFKHIQTTLDRWITFLNRATELDKENLPDELNDPDIIQAMKTIDTMSLNAKEREYYESEKKVMRDRDAVMQTAVENAIENRNLEIAKSLKLKNIPIEIIKETTGLTKDQIDKL